MQIHELNNFMGELGSSSYLAVDDGNDTGRVSVESLLHDVNADLETAEQTLNARIDNIIGGGSAPSEAEIIDARLGANGVRYNSLGTAIRSQFEETARELTGGIILEQSDLFQGGMSQRVIITSTANRICTHIYKVCAGMKVSIKTNTNVQVGVYLYVGNSMLSDNLVPYDYYPTKMTIRIPDDGYLFVQCKKADDSNLTPSDYDADVKIFSLPGSNQLNIEGVSVGHVDYTGIVNGSYYGSGEMVSSTVRLRVSNILPVKAGTIIKLNSGSLMYGFGIWEGSLGYANLVRNDETNCPVGTDEVHILRDGYFIITFRKTDNSTITPADFDGEILIYNPSYATLAKELTGLQNGLIPVTPDYYKYDQYIVTALGSALSFASSVNFNSAVFPIKPNTRYIFETMGRTTTGKYFIICDENHIEMSSEGYAPAHTGDIVSIEYETPYNAAYVAMSTTKNADVGGSTIQYMKVSEILSDDETDTASIIDAEQKRIVEAVQKRFVNSTNWDDLAQNYAENPLPTFVQVSDIHGDDVRFGYAVKVANEINALAILNTGDSVAYYSTDDVSYLAGRLHGSNVPMLPTIGNHDSYVLDEQQMFDKFIAPFSDDLVLDSAVGDSTYYYRDFATHKIRVISVNQFQYRGVSNYTTQRNYTQEQIDFLGDALLNTPADYGVIVLLHTPEKPGQAKDPNYPKFFQDEITYDNTGANIYPIYEIIDAFISGGSIMKVWNNIDGNVPATFTANFDFSGKNSGVEFIAYLSGHMHRDSIYYVNGMNNKQLMLNVTCTCAWSHRTVSGGVGTSYPGYTEGSDLPRTIGSVTENAINVYSIDRSRKLVKVARVGSDLPYNLDLKRDFMAIPYSD